jgi:hypothetical protein
VAEYRGFLFSIVFIIIFAGLLSSVPIDLLGQGANPDIVTPVDPALVSGFTASASYNGTLFSNYQYSYSLNSRTWVCFAYGDTSLQLGAKILYGGFLWLGGYDMVNFGSRGQSLTWAEIEADAEEATASYAMTYVTGGSSAGTLIVYWNETLYATPALAWASDALNIIHGVGIADTARADIGSLLIGLLLLQLPDCPLLINLLLATPLYAAVIYLIWFIIKETIPFV